MSERFEVAILGAGFGGLAMAHALSEIGIDDVAIFERADGVGGTWRANTYPGAACDVPSHLYSLSYAPNLDWSRAYATQPEILTYIEDCYDRLDVRLKVRTSTAIVAASWDEDRQSWALSDHRGDTYEAAVFVSAVGMFHTPAMPEIDGMDDFGGTAFHSARWNHDHDLAGRRVAVVGTGASAIQIVPAIADDVARTFVFQRTPAWILPRRDAPYTDEQRREFADDPASARQHRDELFQLFEQGTSFLRDDPGAVMLTELGSSYLAEKVADPELRERLRPTDPIGCKRTLVSSAFYPAVQRPDVDLVTTSIERITPTGIRTVDGAEWDCDTIVWCTGFRAADYLHGIEVSGRGGLGLHAHWDGVPRAYHGVAVPGFPNFFMLYGPNTNQGGNSIILMLETQAAFIADTLAATIECGVAEVEVSADAMDAYVAELLVDLDTTVWTDGCDSYFRNAAGDVVTQIPHTSTWYAERLRGFIPEDFVTRSAPCSTP